MYVALCVCQCVCVLVCVQAPVRARARVCVCVGVVGFSCRSRASKRVVHPALVTLHVRSQRGVFGHRFHADGLGNRDLSHHGQPLTSHHKITCWRDANEIAACICCHQRGTCCEAIVSEGCCIALCKKATTKEQQKPKPTKSHDCSLVGKPCESTRNISLSCSCPW